MYKVGDKVKVVNETHGWAGVSKGDEGVIAQIHGNGYYGAKIPTYDKNLTWTGMAECFELVTTKLTQDQRISTLEQAQASLEQEVESLKAEVASLKLGGTITHKVSVTAKELTPNEQRKAVIAEAKAFVETKTYYLKDSTECDGGYSAKKRENPNHCTVVAKCEFVVSSEKRTVVALIKYENGHLLVKAVAKCTPDDVFNADIGKAIALGRALGLDVKRFEQAVQPSEVVVGMKNVAHLYKGDDNPSEFIVERISESRGEIRLHSNKQCDTYWPYEPHEGDRILDDTEAKY